MDFHKTWMGDGPWPRMDPVYAWCGWYLWAQKGTVGSLDALLSVILVLFFFSSISSGLMWTHLISFAGNGSSAMPSPKDNGCSCWKDPVGKTGTCNFKKTNKIGPTVNTRGASTSKRSALKWPTFFRWPEHASKSKTFLTFGLFYSKLAHVEVDWHRATGREQLFISVLTSCLSKLQG